LVYGTDNENQVLLVQGHLASTW